METEFSSAGNPGNGKVLPKLMMRQEYEGTQSGCSFHLCYSVISSWLHNYLKTINTVPTQDNLHRYNETEWQTQDKIYCTLNLLSLNK